LDDLSGFAQSRLMRGRGARPQWIRYNPASHSQFAVKLDAQRVAAEVHSKGEKRS